MSETKKQQRENEERRLKVESYKPEARRLLEPRLRMVEEMIENLKSNWPGVSEVEKVRLIITADRIAEDNLDRFASELMSLDENISRLRASIERINKNFKVKELA